MEAIKFVTFAVHGLFWALWGYGMGRANVDRDMPPRWMLVTTAVVFLILYILGKEFGWIS